MSMGYDVNIDGIKFHIPSGYAESISGKQGALEHYNKMDNVVCYERNGSKYNFFIIATKNVGNKKIDDIERGGKHSTINGKQGIIKKLNWDQFGILKKANSPVIMKMMFNLVMLKMGSIFVLQQQMMPI